MNHLIKKFLIAFLAGLTVVLMTTNIFLFIQQRQLKKDADIAQSRIAEANNQLHLLEHLLKIDSLLLTLQNLDSLNVHYQFLQREAGKYKSRIQDRISYIANYQQGNQAETVEISRLYDQLVVQEKRIQSLNTSLANVYAESKQTIDDLKAQLSKQSDLLVNQKTELSKKDKIQIITFTSSKGIMVHYMGEVTQGKAIGNGMGIWATGSKYQGEWLNNERHGKGTYLWSDGDNYEGDYMNDLRSGYGIYHFKTGERYEGEWIDDKRNGEGTLFDKDSNVRFRGKWVDDKPQVK